MKPLSWNGRIPRTRLYLSNAELISALWRALFSGADKGVPVDEFEKKFAAYCGAASAAAGSYARTCFYFLLKALDLPAGSEIIATPINIHDMFNMALCAGLRPVFIDIDPANYQMSPEALERAITPRTRAVLVTHLFGIVPDMEKIAAICEKHGLILIEDPSHSFGATLRGRHVGTFGKAGVFSFSSLKTICSGFGGIIVSDDAPLMAKIRHIQSGLRACTGGDLQWILRKNIIVGVATAPPLFGYATFPVVRFLNMLNPAIVARLQTDNPVQELLHEVPQEWLWRFSPLQAELALRCLQRLDQDNAVRRKHAQMVLDALTPYAADRLPALLPDAVNVFWRFPFRAPEGLEFVKFMNRYGIDVTTTMLPCCSRLPLFEAYAAPTPHAARAVQEAYFLPVEHWLSEKQVATLAEAAVAFVRAGS
jgi:dTDP-4-amino-4,6-dideoxygalactose transaminase